MSDAIIQLTKNNFESEVIQSDLPVVIDLWAPWCGPCRMIGPVLERLAKQYAGSVKVAKVNVDEERELAGLFQVRSIPMVVAMRGNQVLSAQIGFQGAMALNKLFQEALAKSPEPRQSTG